MIIDDFSASPAPINPVRRAYSASLELTQIPGEARSRALRVMADALQRRQNDILEANTLDLEASREMEVPELIGEWLKLTPKRLETTVEILKRLGDLPDPIGRVMSAPYQLEQCQGYYQFIPLGAIALIYEAFPELGAIAAGFCLKTANSLILMGGSEAHYSNQTIAATLQSALEDAGMPPGCLEAISADSDHPISNLVTQDRHINLVIPYGRPQLIQQVVNQATVPVLKSAMGNCYLYWSATANVDLARWMILESYRSEPDPVNAIEKVLIDPNQKTSSLVRLWNSLREEGFELRGDRELVENFPELTLAEFAEWSNPYLNKTVAFRFVENLESAIAWMNQYSSNHANCLATESYSESRQFAQNANSALTFINTSPRFSRHQNRGDAIFLGMSNQKGYRRGLISLETLTTLKHVVQGNGKV
ncbi:MAG: glutamate-5-semialdehyde dehydrogenase [Limnospira sp.]